MNNRHLFRGKRKELFPFGSNWFIGNLVEMEGGGCCIVKDLTINQRMNFEEVNPETVGQCTGIPAKKSYRGESELDKLIFEGDIVKITLSNSPIAGKVIFERICEIKWREYGGAEFIAYHHETDCIYTIDNYSDIEIIGNIHDNPELLGVKRDE